MLQIPTFLTVRKSKFSEVRIWQCGIHGEVAKNVVKAVYIAIFIKVMPNAVLILE